MKERVALRYAVTSLKVSTPHGQSVLPSAGKGRAATVAARVGAMVAAAPDAAAAAGLQPIWLTLQALVSANGNRAASAAAAAAAAAPAGAPDLPMPDDREEDGGDPADSLEDAAAEGNDGATADSAAAGGNRDDDATHDGSAPAAETADGCAGFGGAAVACAASTFWAGGACDGYSSEDSDTSGDDRSDGGGSPAAGACPATGASPADDLAAYLRRSASASSWGSFGGAYGGAGLGGSVDEPSSGGAAAEQSPRLRRSVSGGSDGSLWEGSTSDVHAL